MKTVSIAIFSYISTGSLKYVLFKALLSTKSHGVPDSKKETLRNFQHPEILMLLALLIDLCLLPIYILMRKRLRKRLDDGEDLNATDQKYAANNIFQPILIISALCDGLASNMQLIGIMYLDLSLSAIMTGFCTAITGLFSVVFLKRTLNLNNKVAIIMITVGAVAAGLSGYLLYPPATTSSLAVLGGLLMCLFADILHCTQGTVQELYLKDRSIHPFHGLGMEALLNIIIQSICIICFNYVKGNGPRGTILDTYDAYLQIINNGYVPLMLVTIMISSLITNVSSIVAIKCLSCVHRSFLGSIRTGAVWLTQLFIKYMIGAQNYGEELNRYSLLRFDGYLLIMLGSLLYSSKQDLKYILWSKQPENDEETLVPSPPT